MHSMVRRVIPATPGIFLSRAGRCRNCAPGLGKSFAGWRGSRRGVHAERNGQTITGDLCACFKIPNRWKRIEISASPPYRRGHDHNSFCPGFLLSFRVRRRASLELELVALRHRVSVLRRQRKGRLQLFATDRLLWVWLYRIWPQVLNAMVLVKPATVIQWNCKGFRLYWRWRSGSRHLG